MPLGYAEVLAAYGHTALESRLTSQNSLKEIE
jgi:hypothetical protein